MVQTKLPQKHHWIDILKKTELSIVNEEESLRSLLEKRYDITERLRLVKSDPSEGNLGRKCHLRLGRNARTCTYGHGQSLFSCGKELKATCW